MGSDPVGNAVVNRSQIERRLESAEGGTAERFDTERPDAFLRSHNVHIKLNAKPLSDLGRRQCISHLGQQLYS